jgi:hypothetical protein
LASTRRTSVKLRLQNLLDEQLEIEQGGGRYVIKLDLAYRF